MSYLVVPFAARQTISGRETYLQLDLQGWPPHYLRLLGFARSSIDIVKLDSDQESQRRETPTRVTVGGHQSETRLPDPRKSSRLGRGCSDLRNVSSGFVQQRQPVQARLRREARGWFGKVKYPPAEPEALWVTGPSKGPYRAPKSKSRDLSSHANSAFSHMRSNA
jgi:hypothetical protein